jgi:peptide/nickel transport system substrate-binding protein
VRYYFIVLGIVVKLLTIVLLVFMAGCARRETTVKIVIGNMPFTFDAIMLNETVTNMVNRNIFETLIHFEGTRPVPHLATDWFAQDDSTMVVNFRRNVKFSDGTPMTAVDVIASMYRAIRHPGSSVFSFNIQIVSFEVHDNYSLHINHKHFNDTPANLVGFLSHVPIHRAIDIMKNDDEHMRLNPIGTGEYFLKSANSNLITLQKNKFHRNYRRERSTPYIVELHFEPSLDTILQRLVNNEYDLMLYLPMSLLDDVLPLPQYTIYYQPQALVSYLMLDIARDDTPGISLPFNPLKDQRVRRAIAHAMNVQYWADEVFHGKVQRLAVPGPSHLFGYPDHLEPYKYDPELSRSLMAAANLSEGFDFAISMADTRFYSIIGDLIAEDLKKININVVLDKMPFAELVHKKEHAPPTAFYSVILSPTLVSHIDTIFVDFFIYEPLLGTLRFNHMRNQHIEIIEAITRLNSVHESDPRRYTLLTELSELVYEEAVVIPIFQHKNLHLMNNKFRFDGTENYLFTCIKIR